jgi:transposase
MFYGLDAHKRFVQICEIGPGGERSRDFRIAATAEEITKFARTLGPDDSVVLEATFHTRAIWALLVPHAGRVVVANPMQVKAIAHARVKTDKVDAHILAQLLRLDFIPEVEMPDTETWALRQLVSQQRFLGKQRVALRNRIRSLLNSRLWHCPFVDLFGAAGRGWLRNQPFAEEERMILEITLQLHDTLQDRMQILEAALRQEASGRLEARLLMTIPGVNVTVAIGLMAAIGDIRRFPTPGQLASYFGLVTRVHQSADHCYHGQITKAGRSHGRWLAIEAAQSLAQSTSPLVATYHRVRRKKGHNVAVTALARKLIVLVWHMLTKSEPYRYAPVARTRQKLRRVTPGIGPAGKGQVPRTLEAVYEEAGLPRSALSTTGERRMKARNLRTVTMARRTSPLRRDSMGTTTRPLRSPLEESISDSHRIRGRQRVLQS